MDRIRLLADWNLMTDQQKVAVLDFINQLSKRLQDAVISVMNSFAANNEVFAKMWEQIQEFRQTEEQPVKKKPLRLRDLPKTLPMRHQVLNRKPVLQVARSRC
ncbi:MULTISPECIES: hypothetical protein [unclassified Paenibacillus]|uniref:hypothetical protein n=1 Tax=unclassified Paenibacillus TaxID=185978 RepID=UPI0026598973|nr:hypothetical protein [Paenibacillus sp. 11B]